MPEQYDIAAWRHQGTAEYLFEKSQYDDAGYHYGMVGENAIKHALRTTGIEAYFLANPRTRRVGRRMSGDPLKNTPMRGHFPSLQSLAISVRSVVSLYATGRIAGKLQTELASTVFAGRYSNWHIDIRYASTTYTPVTETSCRSWQTDAEELVLNLVL